MKHTFTLIVATIGIDLEGIEDKLYAAGCSDGLIHRDNELTLSITFDREAPTMPKAIWSAIDDVRKVVGYDAFIEQIRNV